LIMSSRSTTTTWRAMAIAAFSWNSTTARCSRARGFSRRSSWLSSQGYRLPSSTVGRPIPSFMPVAEGTKTKLYVVLACSDNLLLLYRGLSSKISMANPLTGFHTSVSRPLVVSSLSAATATFCTTTTALN
jgi:hypothetical protein